MRTSIAAEQKKIDREYSRLYQCYSNFVVLKQKVAELEARAATDPAAAKKLGDLQALIPGSISELELSAEKDIRALGIALKQLQSRIKNIVNNS